MVGHAFGSSKLIYLVVDDESYGIIPDLKDWTWVLERPCLECGFDAQRIAPEDVAGQLTSNAASWPALLSRDDIRKRPSPMKWSLLEYGCHVRDVFRVYDGRLLLMLTEEDPLFQNWDQDSTAYEERYNGQNPSVVASQLVLAGEELARRFAGVHGEQWQRPGRRSDGARFSINTLARYMLHDPIHHLNDVNG